MLRAMFVCLAFAGSCLGTLQELFAAGGFETSLPAEVAKGLTEGSEFTLMSVDPTRIDTVPTEGWKVLTRKSIAKAEIRNTAVDAIKKAINDSASPKHCFLPRHAVAVYHEKRMYVLLICFECSQIRIYADGRLEHQVLIGNNAKDVLDNLLSDSGTTAAAIDGRNEPALAVTNKWYAWNNVMPPGPPSFHIVGDIEVPNPGVDVSLTEKVPQGIDPSILLLDLHFNQKPGLWPQHVATKQVRFDKINSTFRNVVIYSNGKKLVDVPVNDIQ